MKVNLCVLCMHIDSFSGSRGPSNQAQFMKGKGKSRLKSSHLFSNLAHFSSSFFLEISLGEQIYFLVLGLGPWRGWHWSSENAPLLLNHFLFNAIIWFTSFCTLHVSFHFVPILFQKFSEIRISTGKGFSFFS